LTPRGAFNYSTPKKKTPKSKGPIKNGIYFNPGELLISAQEAAFY
jgi:hypothetical protein